MRSILCTVFLFFFLASYTFGSDFLKTQKRYSRVRTAYAEKEEVVLKMFKAAGLDLPVYQIFLRVFKYEQRLELWARSTADDTFRQVKTYPFCSSSGTLGPKRQRGDYQIPEGFYHIDRFNPASNFYLSLGINYPNPSDRILGTAGKLGGDIFIHGDCVTIGCIPITDDKIKELYLTALISKSAGQLKIPVHIFPFDFKNESTKQRILRSTKFSKYHEFWKDLETIYRQFEDSHKLQQIEIKPGTGRYYFK